MTRPLIQAWEVRDLDLLVRRALDHELAARKATLHPDDYRAAHTYLLSTAWEEAQRYDPARAKPNPANGTPTNFYSYCYRRIRWRYTDWLRHTYGDTRHRQRPPLSLDASSYDPDRDSTDIDSAHTRPDGLGLTIPQSQSDPATHSDPDLQRLLNPRNRVDARILDQPRTHTAKRTR